MRYRPSHASKATSSEVNEVLLNWWSATGRGFDFSGTPCLGSRVDAPSDDCATIAGGIWEASLSFEVKGGFMKAEIGK